MPFGVFSSSDRELPIPLVVIGGFRMSFWSDLYSQTLSGSWSSRIILVSVLFVPLFTFMFPFSKKWDPKDKVLAKVSVARANPILTSHSLALLRVRREHGSGFCARRSVGESGCSCLYRGA